ncbi:MAG TPA: 50S ribosomal protein L17, partial [Planctomycetota bacterium]|nr:50S ribosomal protein L17 [Planctomycetota bacterium]
MRHRLRGRKLGRTTEHRKALARNLVTDLFRHGRIVTTVQKAKEFRGLADRLVTWAKKGDARHYRMIASVVKDRRVVQKLMADIAKRFETRPGGYTRYFRLGGSRWDGEGHGRYAANRLGDNAERAIWELSEARDHEQELYLAGRGKG